MDSSHPKGHSVNNGISKALCSLKYLSINEAIKEIVKLGTISKNGYKKYILPNVDDRHMLGMLWNGGGIHRHLPP